MATNIRETRKPWGKRHNRVDGLVAGWQHFKQLVRDDVLPAYVLCIDQSRLPSHRDRLFEPAHFQFAIYCGREARRQLDALPPNRLEAGETEGDDIGAGPQIDDAVKPLFIGEDGADLFNEGRTGCLDGHAGQHCSGRVSEDSRDAARLLCERGA